MKATLLTIIALAGCSPAATKEAARDAYAGQQLECVDKYDTRAEIDACRQRVRDTWGTTRDGGAK